MVSRPTAKHASHPLAIRLVNRLGERLGDRASIVSLCPSVLTRRAEILAGLEDWGHAGFHEGLAQLSASFATARLTLAGRIMLRNQLLGLLTNRLQLVNLRKSIQNQPDDGAVAPAPVFIVSLPRTGTTFLHGLLSLEPGTRHLKTYEALWPCPRPDDPRDPRRRKAEAAKALAFINWLSPNLRAIHALDVESPEECYRLLQCSFASHAFEIVGHFPEYKRWLATQDLTWTYEEFSETLRVLSKDAPASRWVMKSPYHLLEIDTLRRVFPRAILIQTHRDPVNVIASLCSLYWTLHGMSSDDVDPRRLGPQVLDYWARAMNACVESRARDSSDSFVDVSFRELVSDPAAVMSRLRALLGLQGSTDSRSPDWEEGPAKTRRQVHNYALEDYGLTPIQVREALAPYVTAFGHLF